MIDNTPEQIAKDYLSDMERVNLINKVLANPDDYTDDPTILSRNVDHLKIAKAWDFWTDEDMTPFDNAIAAGS